MKKPAKPAARRASSCETVTVITSRGRLPVKVVRRPRQKCLRLRVDASGVVLSGPSGLKPIAVERMLLAHWDWVCAQLNRKRPAVSGLIPFQTSHLPANGRMWPVVWCEAEVPSLKWGEQGWVIAVPRHPRAVQMAQEMVRAQWEKLVREGLMMDLARCSAVMGKAPVRIEVKAVSSIWGRLNASDHVLLDLALALVPPPVRRYVWIHELCHLMERNHSSRFWAWVARFCPEWKTHKQWLSEHGTMVKASVQAVLA